MRVALVVALAALGAGGCADILGVTEVPDPPPCPADYTGSIGQSRYRFVDRTMTWQEAQDDCRNDLEGSTHLVVFDDLDEMMATYSIIEPLDPPPWDVFAGYGRDYAGDPEVFFAVTGEQLDLTGRYAALWDNNEPNNFDGIETTTIFSSNRPVWDAEPTRKQAYLCECDGRAVTRTFTLGP